MTTQEEFGDDDFQGSAAQFDVDYLERISSDSTEPSELTRQSLYVKFDPLVGRDSPKDSPAINESAVDAILETDSDSSTIPSLLVAKVEPVDKPSESGQDNKHIVPLLDEVDSDAALLTNTSSTVHELIYSEDEVAEILEKLMSQECEKEGSKYLEELASLQRELITAQEVVTHLKSGKGVRTTIKQCHQQDLAELELVHRQHRALADEHDRLEAFIVDGHEEKQSQVLKQLDEIHTSEKDLQSLEHSLEDLLKRYATLKEQSSSLETHNTTLAKEIKRLEDDLRRSCEEHRRLEKEHVSQVDKANISHESLRKELASKLAVERVTTKKLELELVGLKNEQENKIRDKEQLAKICDDLLLELNN